MAPMEPAHADEGLNQDVLKEALAKTSLEDLQEMGKRLHRSQEQFNEMLGDLQAEQRSLSEEREHLNDTITMMMREMQKLNIGSGNTVEPMLDEGPLDFVGRMWEKVKPRNNAVVISEHVGEIRKPEEQDGATPNIQQQGRQAIQRLSSALGPIWQRAEGLVRDARGEIAKQVAEHQKQRAHRGSKEGKSERRRAARSAVGADGEAVQVTSLEPSPAEPQPVSAAAPAEGAAEAAPEEAADAPAKSEEGEAKEQISSTILIEAQLKIDDGSTQTLHVRAADRCKEVAHRFVQEHSLKAWFEEPLTTWLKKVEADADRFPVKIEADLMEIRKQHSKK